MFPDPTRIREAETSAWLTTYRMNDPLGRPTRHFFFGGADYCFEVLSRSEPVIREFSTQEEAFAWARLSVVD